VSTTIDDPLETRRSLLSRLRNLDDRESWSTFLDLYSRLLYNVARRAGCGESDAQDIVQETVVAVAREIPRFVYDPARGSFKQWLFRIARRRIADHFRRTYRQPPRSPISLELMEDDEAVLPPAAAVSDLDLAWDEEWERSIFAAAVERVRTTANPRHFQVFDYCVLKAWPAGKVAATLGLNVAQVYLARHRVSHSVKLAAREINEQRSRGILS
jgi:RNA polymerase sigma factor (sigma-70 family)